MNQLKTRVQILPEWVRVLAVLAAGICGLFIAGYVVVLLLGLFFGTSSVGFAEYLYVFGTAIAGTATMIVAMGLINLLFNGIKQLWAFFGLDTE